MKRSLLVIDDSKSILESVRMMFSNSIDVLITLSNPNEIPSTLESYQFDVVLLDMNYSSGVSNGNEGLFWLKEIKEKQTDVPVILFTAYASIELAVRGIKEGAFDFVVKPWDNEHLKKVVFEALSNRKGARSSEKPGAKSSLTGKKGVLIEPASLILNSETMSELYRQVACVAPTDANVLILGETGTGKEMLARYIHENSLRANKRFSAIDLGTLNESIFESELFGHKKGSFTDASKDRIGLIRKVENGTLFFDEIGNISMSMQAKLLNLIQNKFFIPVGSDDPYYIDFRLIAATNIDLEQASMNGSFREDLYFRMSTIQFTIPPLRDRPEDILQLAQHFIDFFSLKYKRSPIDLLEGQKTLMNYSWPGNIRELRHHMERVVLLYPQAKNKDDIWHPRRIYGHSRGGGSVLELAEAETIQKSFRANNRNISKTAKALGITRQTLYAKIEKYGIK